MVAVAARSQRGKPDNDEKMKTIKRVSGKKIVSKLKEEEKMSEKNVADKVSEAIASGEIDSGRVVKDNEAEKEIVVEKQQTEEMETLPAGHDEDEEEAELQMIKDEEEEENQEPVPDIAEKMADVLNEQKAKEAKVAK